MISRQAISEFLRRRMKNYLWMKKLKLEDYKEEYKHYRVKPMFKKEPWLHQHTMFHIANCVPYFCFFFDMGTGKTAGLLNIITQRQREKKLKRALVTVNGQLTIGSWATAIETYSDLHPILVTDTDIEAKWEKLIAPKGDICVIDYPGLHLALSKKVKGKKKNSLVMDTAKVEQLQKIYNFYNGDECFVGDTRISTPNGSVRIDSVQKGLRIHTGCGEARVASVFSKKVFSTFKVRLSNETEFECTEDHPVFTESGWKPVNLLEQGTRLFCYEDMSNLWQSNSTTDSKELLCEKEWHTVCANTTRNSFQQKNLLQSILREEIEESNESAGNEGQSICDPKTYWAQADATRWEWQGNDKNSENNGKSFRCWMESRGCSKNTKESQARIPTALQSRYSEHKRNDSSRVGWVQSPRYCKKKTRCEKRYSFKQSRVESIEIIKHTSGIYVYNLQVENHPSYFANGVLAHNCHKVKNKDTLRFTLLDKLTERMDYRYLMTGTPMGRNAEDVFAQFYLADRGETFGDSLEGLFRHSFFTDKPHAWKGVEYVFDMKKEKLFYDFMQNRSIRYTEDECGDIPKCQEIPLYVEFTTEQREHYLRAVEGLINAGGKFADIDNSYHKMRQIVAGFIHWDDEYGEHTIRLDDNPKIDMLEEFLDASGSAKVIISHEYQESGQIITDKLKELGIDYEHVWGKSKDDIKAVERFKTQSSKKVFVMQSEVGGTGTDGLQDIARYLLFYESPTSPITRRQVIKRIHRSGQLKRTFVYDAIMKNSIDIRVLEFIQQGKDVHDALVEGRSKSTSLLLLR